MSDLLEKLASVSRRLAEADDLDGLLDIAFDSLADLFGYEHIMLFVAELDRKTMITLATRGYDRAGVGSEVRIGEGIVGVVAERRKPVRIGDLGVAIRYLRSQDSAGTCIPDKEIPLPGLPDVRSQIGIPMLTKGRLIGVMCVESRRIGAFGIEDQHVLTVVANFIAAFIAASESDVTSPEPARADGLAVDGEPVKVRYYAEDSSVFVEGEYLIKSLPGRILWRLLSDWSRHGQTEFTNKELRLDASLGLPAIKDNLDTRLILLRRRLEERCETIRIVKDGRGRFRLEVGRPLALEAVD